MIPHISPQLRPPRNNTVQQSCVGQALPHECFIYCTVTLEILVCSLNSGLATALFDVCSWNEYLTTVLHSSARVGACYVTCRRGQVSLNHRSTWACYEMFKDLVSIWILCKMLLGWWNQNKRDERNMQHACVWRDVCIKFESVNLELVRGPSMLWKINRSWRSMV
jgi:hypothetical protein